MSTSSKPYKDTLNLPATKFEMKANLKEREPIIQARWREQNLYQQIRAARKGRPRRVLHDGPPYANGEIHMGHLLNKVLKDVIVRYFTMRGFDSPYVPGWDCHGLPIEHRVVRELGSRAHSMSPLQIRELCHKDALHWVDLQRSQFQRLGVSGDWDHPYLTLDPRYEAGILDVLADLVEHGFVFRQLKPIHWDIHDRTALAEAELEYQDHTSPSVHVLFPVVESKAASAWGEGPWNLLIWTTTPWTLPANVAIAAHPDVEYAGVRFEDPESGKPVQAILAAPLVERTLALKGVSQWQTLGRCTGRALEKTTYRHVFIDRTSPVVLADYVTVEDGTGLVHTAPGHGIEDFRTGIHYGLPVLSPVDESGRFTAEAPAELLGKGVFEANPAIIATLKSRGALFHGKSYQHSYPHGWRSKTPVIFRATSQWFIGVDRNELRDRALAAINQVRWLPAWGKNRIESMVAGRPDWCISRQRAWGVPIPVLYDAESGYQHLTPVSVRFHRELFAREGSDAWYRKSVSQLVPPDLDTRRYPVENLRKGTDILDVWFESGSSHRAVLGDPSFDSGPTPCFMYLEGSDQHRGWFQSSLLTSVGSRGSAPFQNVLTHGFVVDENGEKMSKSVGNVIPAVEATEEHGADVLRLYVASMDYADDVRMSPRGIKEASEAYRKIRNTFRYLLGNLEDYRRFNPAEFDLATLDPLDRWALAELNRLVQDVTAAFESFEFYRAFQRIYQFCSVDLSSFYLDILKDRLYAEAPLSAPRRSAQFVLARLHAKLTRLLAPILPHTCEELWSFLPESQRAVVSVHLAAWPEPDPEPPPTPDAPSIDWTYVLALRASLFRYLEKLRAEKVIGSNQEAHVTIASDDPARHAWLRDHAEWLQSILIVSVVDVPPASALGPDAQADAPLQLRFRATRSTHPKCERCWNMRPSVGQYQAHPTLCARCAGVVESLGSN
jgi:isoleucyl-tRNA synthetase